MRRTKEIYQIDSFADQPFTGNPAAVCLLEKFPSDLWMQSFAAEMNLSETAFVCPSDNGFQLRWFTPTTEVDLCGHATLAAAHALWESGRLPVNEMARFQTLSGDLQAEFRDGQIELDFPAEPPIPQQSFAELLACLSHSPISIAKNRMDYLVELSNELEVEEIEINLDQLAKIPTRGLIVTAHSKNPEYHFVSRFFAPSVGVDEDPVTGSAHCCLAPYWADKLGLKCMNAYQSSARGGKLSLRLTNNRVILGGTAQTIFKGELTID